VILVHHHRDMGKFLDGGQDHVAQKGGPGIFTGTGTGLHDHRAVGFSRRLHDGPGLLQVVDVEGRHAVAVFRRVIEQLPHAD
jgi:hypothetical protein